MRRALCWILCFGLAQTSRAQTLPVPPEAAQSAPGSSAASAAPLPPAPPSPAGIYQDLVRSVDEVRNDMSNWSDTELAAFGAAVKDAATQCPELQKTAYDGEELLGLARVCALGQNWPSTYSAARRYTRDANSAHPVDGYSLLLQADLHLTNAREALDTLKELRGAGPLTQAQDGLFQYVVSSLAVTDPGYAEAAALLRHPDLLACMSACTSDLPHAQAEVEAWQDIALVWENDRTDTHDAALELEAAARARTAPLNATEAQAVAMAQRQFRLLGRPLPAGFGPQRCGPATSAHRPAATCTVAYIVAPEDAPTTPALMRAVEDFDGRLSPAQAGFLILSGCTGTFKLRSPHTLCKPGPVLATLGAAGPSLVIADSSGMVAWISPATTTWLNLNGAATVILQRIANRDAATALPAR